jgi:hypothetical protein
MKPLKRPPLTMARVIRAAIQANGRLRVRTVNAVYTMFTLVELGLCKVHYRVVGDD